MITKKANYCLKTIYTIDSNIIYIFLYDNEKIVDDDDDEKYIDNDYEEDQDPDK